jgi:hypothetical protein
LIGCVCRVLERARACQVLAGRVVVVEDGEEEGNGGVGVGVDGDGDDDDDGDGDDDDDGDGEGDDLDDDDDDDDDDLDDDLDDDDLDDVVMVVSLKECECTGGCGLIEGDETVLDEPRNERNLVALPLLSSVEAGGLEPKSVVDTWR